MPGQDAETVNTAFAEQTHSSRGTSAIEGLGKRETSG